MERIILLPVDDIFDRPSARITGREAGLVDVVAVNGNFLVTKTRGRKYFGGQGQPQKYARTNFEVWEVADANFRRDTSQQQIVNAHRRIEFDKSV